MNSRNNVIITGNLTKDLDILNFDNRGKIAKTGIAFNSGYKDKKTGEWIDNPTQFFNIQFSRFSVDKAVKHLKKGSYVQLQGCIKAKSYKDNDGSNKIYNFIEVSSFIQILVHKKTDEIEPSNEEIQASSNDLPF